MVIDALVGRHTYGRRLFDETAALPERQSSRAPSQIDARDPYFALPPPKSCGRNRWPRVREPPDRDRNPITDLIATATELTARSIGARDFRAHRDAREVIVSAEGSQPQIMRRLRELLSDLAIRLSDATASIPMPRKPSRRHSRLRTCERPPATFLGDRRAARRRARQELAGVLTSRTKLALRQGSGYKSGIGRDQRERHQICQNRDSMSGFPPMPTALTSGTQVSRPEFLQLSSRPRFLS